MPIGSNPTFTSNNENQNQNQNAGSLLEFLETSTVNDDISKTELLENIDESSTLDKLDTGDVFDEDSNVQVNDNEELDSTSNMVVNTEDFMQVSDQNSELETPQIEGDTDLKVLEDIVSKDQVKELNVVSSIGVDVDIEM